MKNLLDAATYIATIAHKGQVDKAGNDYIEHPLYVASLVESEEAKAVALLHDVIEDTPTTLDDLENIGFSQEIVAAVDAMTKTPGVEYSLYLKRVKANMLARIVKLADLKHNADLSRIAAPTEKDYRRCEKYRNAIAYLL